MTMTPSQLRYLHVSLPWHCHDSRAMLTAKPWLAASWVARALCNDCCTGMDAYRHMQQQLAACQRRAQENCSQSMHLPGNASKCCM